MIHEHAADTAPLAVRANENRADLVADQGDETNDRCVVFNYPGFRFFEPASAY